MTYQLFISDSGDEIKAKVSLASCDPICEAKLIGNTRTKLKSEIAASKLWDEYRGMYLENKNTGQLTKKELIVTALVMGVDVQAILDAENSEETTDAKEVEAIEVEETETPQPAVNNAPDFAAAQIVIDKCLQDAEPWISPKLADQLKTGVSTLVNAAVIEIESAEINTQPVGSVQEGTYVQAQPTGSVKAASIFEGMARNKTFKELDVTQWNAKNAPRPDAKFVFNAETLRDIMVSVKRGRTVFLTGPAGTGKTSLPREIAARLKRPFTRIAHTRTTEPQSLIGANLPHESGGIKWHDGALTQAIRKAGNIILLDEPSFCPSGTLAMYQTLLDHRYLTLEETGEVVSCARGVMFVIADNTAGNGDMTGRYSGTNTMNAAFIDRSAKIIHIDYLPAKEEIAALENHTGCNDAYAKELVSFATLTRTAASKGEVTGGLSFRRLIEFTFDIQDGVDAERAFQNCVLNLMPDDDAQAARELAKAHLSFKKLERLLGGNDPQVNATIAQTVSKAAKGFEAVDPNEIVTA